MRLHLRPIPRERLEEAVGWLAGEYPKTFVLNGKLRLPLKIGIEADLRQDGADATAIAALEFYQQSWDYLQCLQAGAKRVDLDGVKVGTVTAQEASAAQKQLTEEQTEVARRRSESNSSTLPASLTRKRSDPPAAACNEVSATKAGHAIGREAGCGSPVGHLAASAAPEDSAAGERRRSRCRR
jgi:sRNA-binding protein